MISIEAVEAAMSALGEAYGEDAYCRERQYVVTALEAAVPHMLEQAWDTAYQAALEDEGLGRTTTPNPYRSQA